MKNLKKVLALLLAVSMLMGFAVTASAADYKDSTSVRYPDAVEVLSALSILDGFPDGEFKPLGTLTRGQAAKIVSIIHNATVAGEIQDIGSLYANSGDWFADSKNHWARAYINYCKVCKLVDGMSETTFAPEGLLTGTQFLKMMLNTLGFLSAKEGYTGTGWDINVLERANQVGLTDGLAKDWRAADPLKRDEAAQIIFNALTCGMVEYGNIIKGYRVDDYPMLSRAGYTENAAEMGDFYQKLKVAFVTGEVVDYTGYTLAGAMGVTLELAYDAFWRPGHLWTYNGKSYFFMFKPLAEYKQTTNACDILKDIGVPESSGKRLPFKFHAVDGVKEMTGPYSNDFELFHASDKSCKTDNFGCMGTLTQVFKVGSEYVITEIHTWLGKVKKVVNDGHAVSAHSEIEIFDKGYGGDYYSMYGTLHFICNGVGIPGEVIGSASFAKDTYVLVNYSHKTERAEIVETATARTGVLNGASGYNFGETTTIDGTKYNNSCRFALGIEQTATPLNNGLTFTWFFDFYGNVIGCAPITITRNLVVIDKLWNATSEQDGVYKAVGNLIDFEAKDTKADIKKIRGFETAWYPIPISTAYIHNYRFYNELYFAVKDKDGNYELTDAVDGDPKWEFVAHVATDTIRAAALERADGSLAVKLTEKTNFLVKDLSGTYKAYTGYKSLPTLTASWYDVIVDDDGYATDIYLAGVLYGTGKVTAFVPSVDVYYNWVDGYQLLPVYVNGEEVLISVSWNVLQELRFGFVPGMYTFNMSEMADGVSAASAVKAEIDGMFEVVSVSADGSTAVLDAINEWTWGWFGPIYNPNPYKIPSGTYALGNAKLFDATGKPISGTSLKPGDILLCYIVDGGYQFYKIGP